jgi:hypothetical protein
MTHPDQPDYPAAHSMDTWWFAVDERGQVAVFDTNENGPVPPNEPTETWEAIEEALPPELDGLPGESLAAWYAARGITYYEYQEDYGGLVRLYERADEAPATPLHVDQLPLAVRRLRQLVCFAGVRFDHDETLQALEFFPCRLYSEGYQVAYLCADGVTVRPVPGREDDFADFVANYRERHPDRAAKLRFDGETS